MFSHVQPGAEAQSLQLQAEALGSQFRNVMYPRYGPAGGGLLRLHSTYRHDLKIYSSDEGRVQTSAAAFTQGLLDLEGTSLTPILVRWACPWKLTLHKLAASKVHPLQRQPPKHHAVPGRHPSFALNMSSCASSQSAVASRACHCAAAW